MVPGGIFKKSAKRKHTDRVYRQRAARVFENRRKCRKMLEQVLSGAAKLNLPKYAGLTESRVAEMRAIFSAKRGISRDARIRKEDHSILKAGLVDLKHGLNYINTHGIKKKQREDGSYEHDEGEEDAESKEEEQEEEEVEEEKEGVEGKEQSAAGNDAEDVEMTEVTSGTRRLRIVSRKEAEESEKEEQKEEEEEVE